MSFTMRIVLAALIVIVILILIRPRKRLYMGEDEEWYQMFGEEPESVAEELEANNEGEA